MKTLMIIYFALVLITLTSCQKSGKEATVAGNNSCVTDPASCGGNGVVNGSAYQNNNNNGFNPYPNNYGTSPGFGTNPNYGPGYNNQFNYYNNNAYLCNCPNGTIPTYNGSAGLGCVSSGRMSASAGLSAFFYLSWGQNQWNTLPQLYRYNYGGGNTSCYNGVVQSCNASQPTCPAGYFCNAQVSGVGSLGLCVASHR